MTRLTLSGHIQPEDKARSNYLYLPFDLPAPVRRLTVRYRYSARMAHDRVEGGNVIDIGLFDPRGSEFPGGAGFRGWSGSDRQTFTITGEQATPGYLPGPLPAGRYQIILGLYRICPQGAAYEIEVQAAHKEEADHPAAASLLAAPASSGHSRPHLTERSRSPADRPWQWLRGDLQSHTDHSDGKGSPAQLVARARALELDYLAITDHNTISHHPTLAALGDENLLLIPGQEVTTYYGHMNVWGTRRWCDFRCQSDEQMATIIALAHDSGGVCSINHPKPGGPAWKYSTALPVDAMEVWQGPWPNRNEESLALWDELLREGRQLPIVGGSDYHCPAGEDSGFLRLGQPTTWVKATERTVPAILAAIRAGRASISASPRGPRLDLRAVASGGSAEMGAALPLAAGESAVVTVEVQDGAGCALHLVTEEGLVHEAILAGERQTVTVETPAKRYLRAELVGDGARERLPDNAPPDLNLRRWRWALSNPIYIHPR